MRFLVLACDYDRTLASGGKVDKKPVEALDRLRTFPCFVEVRRRTRPMVCFVNVESVDRIIYSIFQRFNLEWKTRTLKLFTQAA